MKTTTCSSVAIVCSERSGSNLLKAMLSQHRRVFVGPPIPLFECFRPIMAGYGDLAVDANWEELINDATDLVSVNHQPLPCTVSVNQVRSWAGSETRNWATIVRAVYSAIAGSQNADIFGYKYSTNMQDLGLFLREMQFSHVIYQVRDPRDVALSTMQTGFVKETPEQIVERWRTAQGYAQSALAEFTGPVLTQRYEDLIAAPHKTLQRIWNFLNIAPFRAALDFHANPVNQNIAEKSHAWANLAKPLMRRNSKRFYREWNVDDVRALERLVGPEMKRFGYRKCSALFFRSRYRNPETRVLDEKEYEFIRPQSEKWDELNRKAKARMEQEIAG